MVESPFLTMAEKEPATSSAAPTDVWETDESTTDAADEDEELRDTSLEASGFTPIPRKRPPGVTPWSIGNGPKSASPKWGSTQESPAPPEAPAEAQAPSPEPGVPKLKLGIKATGSQSELSLDSAPRGRFEGENPNVFEGEDLDLPPFLRKKK